MANRKALRAQAFAAQAQGSAVAAEPRDTRAFPTLPLYWTAEQLRTATAAFSAEREHPLLALDCEWTAMQDRRIGWPWTPGCELYSIALTARVHGALCTLTLPWPPRNADARTELGLLLKKARVVFHNACADVMWLVYFGIPFTLAGDTFLLAYLIDEEQPLGLAALAEKYCGIPDWKQPLWSQRPHDDATWAALLSYNGQDTEATYQLAEALHAYVSTLPEDESSAIRNLYQFLMLPTVRLLVDTAITGTPIKYERLLGAITHEERKQGELALQFAEIIGMGMRADRAFKVATSSQQTADYLRAAYGLALEGSAKEDISPYVAEYPAVRVIQDIRNTQKNLSTYLRPWKMLLDEQQDGALHSIYKPHGTRTGRLSAELERGGSLQVAPHDEWVRKLVEPCDPDEDVLVSDYSQIELRVAAWIAPEMTMRELYRAGADIHTNTAARVLGINETSVTKAQRQLAKALNFGLLYGAQVNTFRTTAQNDYGVELSLAEATRLRNEFFAFYPDLKLWHERAESFDLKRGFTITPIGRRRRHMTEFTQAVNSPVQSFASDLLLVAMNMVRAAIARRKLRARFIGLIHDNGLFRCHRADIPELAAVVDMCMRQPNLLPFGIGPADIPLPLVPDIAVGRTWGTALAYPVH